MPPTIRYDFFVSKDGIVSVFQASAKEVRFPHGLKPQSNKAILKLFAKRLEILVDAAGMKHKQVVILAMKLSDLVRHMTNIIQGSAKPDLEWSGDVRHELINALKDFDELYDEVGRIKWLMKLIKKRKHNLHTNVYYSFHGEESLCYSGTTKLHKAQRYYGMVRNRLLSVATSWGTVGEEILGKLIANELQSSSKYSCNT